MIAQLMAAHLSDVACASGKASGVGTEAYRNDDLPTAQSVQYLLDAYGSVANISHASADDMVRATPVSTLTASTCEEFFLLDVPLEGEWS